MTGLFRPITQADLAVVALTRHRGRTAFKLGAEIWTYRAVADRTFSGARALMKLGLRAGDGVAVLSSNRPETFCAATSAQLAGGRYTPLNPYASAADQAFMLGDAEIRFLLFDDVFETRARELAEQCHGLTILPLAGAGAGSLETLSSGESTSPIRVDRGAEDIAVLTYTGGTTGLPKGVMLSHRAIVTNIVTALAEWQFPAHIRILLSSPLSHAAGALVLPTLLRGGEVHLHSRFEPEAVLRAVEAERLTTLLGVPTMIYALLDEQTRRGRDVGSLETFIYGSAPISPTRLEEALACFGPVLMQHYAQTEAPMTVTMLRKEDHDPARSHLLRSCGQPTIGAEVELLGDDGRPVGAGEPGEICVRGPLVMSGYWKRPDESANALRDGWLHTGDIATRDEEDFIYIVDRKKDLIISGGFNIFPKEIEDVLAAHPSVAQAAVIGVPDEHWGELVCGFVVPREGAQIDPEELRSWVRDRKGGVHAPKRFELVSALPTTAVGKIDKVALRAPFWGDRQRRVN